jgi:uncharacterized protein involved in exopolysaccharide biosynthesis
MSATRNGRTAATDQFDELDLATIFQFLRKHWLLLISSAILGAGLAVAASFALQPRYRADATLMASDAIDDSGSAAGLSGPLGGLAAMAGFRSGRQGQLNEAIATLKSRVLTERYIEQQNLLPTLFSRQWDSKTGRWRTAANKTPTNLDGYHLFDRSIRTVTEDKKTGLVTISIEWTDPKLAAKWARDFVDQTNEYLRSQALERANRDLEYLNEQLGKSSVVELRSAISKLIEAEIKKVMIAEGNPEYAFHFVDPPVVPEKKVFPKRILFLFGGAFLGFFSTAFILGLYGEVATTKQDDG